MNYRHAFHAGSFADVFKHAVLCRILHYLRDKPAAFRVIDTHAGAGLYDLTGPEASRGGEWHDGIERLLAAQLPQPVAALLAPYLEVIGALNERGRLKLYPGSPAIARAWLRPQDRLIACELEPQAATALAGHLRGDTRIKTLEIDGWTALSAYVPPPERRGLVLVDPPFEEDGDFHRLSHGLAAAHRKWATGIYALWYPIKGRGEPDALAKSLRRLGIGQDPAGRTHGRAAQRSDPAQRLRPDPGQPALDPGKRAFRPVAGAGRRSWGATARAVSQLDWLAGEARARPAPVTSWPLSTADPVGV